MALRYRRVMQADDKIAPFSGAAFWSLIRTTVTDAMPDRAQLTESALRSWIADETGMGRRTLYRWSTDECAPRWPLVHELWKKLPALLPPGSVPATWEAWVAALPRSSPQDGPRPPKDARRPREAEPEGQQGAESTRVLRTM
jgi:hypothetical protein